MAIIGIEFSCDWILNVSRPAPRRTKGEEKAHRLQEELGHSPHIVQILSHGTQVAGEELDVLQSLTGVIKVLQWRGDTDGYYVAMRPRDLRCGGDGSGTIGSGRGFGAGVGDVEYDAAIDDGCEGG